MAGLVDSVRRHLEPVVAPRGFPVQRADEDAVLLHCDGPAVDRLLARYPTLASQLRRSYGDQPIPCLDLWVTRESGRLSWSFEVPEREVVGPEARARLETTAHDEDADPWVRELAGALEAWFARIEAEQPG